MAMMSGLLLAVVFGTLAVTLFSVFFLIRSILKLVIGALWSTLVALAVPIVLLVIFLRSCGAAILF